MISTPRVRRRGRVRSGALAALAVFAASALTACATPMFRTESHTTEDTLPPMAGTIAPSPVAGEPLVQSEPPAMAGGADATTSEPVDPLAGRLSPAVRATLDQFFPTLGRLLTSTSLGATTDHRDITVLAPTETAFAHLPGEFVRNMEAHRDDVDHVLARHILDGVYTYKELATMDVVLTIGGDSLTVTRWWDGTVMIDGARLYPAVQGSGSADQSLAVYPIDRVLLDGL